METFKINYTMKKLMIIITCAGIMLACSKEEDTTIIQMLKNTDMEKTTEWFSYGSEEGFIHKWTSEASYSPNRSLTISRTTPSLEGYCWFNQSTTQDIPYGKDVTLKVMIKGVDLQGNGVSIIIRCNDAKGELVKILSTQSGTRITGSFEWVEHTITMNKLDKKTATIVVGLVYLPNTTGKVYFDDATLEYKK
jgi:hypothetical protein